MSHSNDTSGPASAGSLFDAAATVTRVMTGLILAALVLLVAGEAGLRGLLNYSLGYAEEVSGYFVVALTFFGAALALRARSLFEVDFIFVKLPAAAKVWLLRAFIVAALAICIVLVWRSIDLVLSSLSRGRTSSTVLRTPLWIPQMLMPAGIAMIGVFLIEQFLLSGRTFAQAPQGKGLEDRG
ncbi:MAG: TRAP transporter small permease [Paracoccus sp. (in: a-proteobacteria)]|uniref:TRAP transporter small permease n=1 Tax=Paracoccus sp. TaxID=267 RepID=UPI002E8CD51B|nr:TRAP transporter small permease [Pseudomonadota bacterium]